MPEGPWRERAMIQSGIVLIGILVMIAVALVVLR